MEAKQGLVRPVKGFFIPISFLPLASYPV